MTELHRFAQELATRLDLREEYSLARDVKGAWATIADNADTAVGSTEHDLTQAILDVLEVPEGSGHTTRDLPQRLRDRFAALKDTIRGQAEEIHTGIAKIDRLREERDKAESTIADLKINNHALLERNIALGQQLKAIDELRKAWQG